MASNQIASAVGYFPSRAETLPIQDTKFADYPYSRLSLRNLYKNVEITNVSPINITTQSKTLEVTLSAGKNECIVLPSLEFVSNVSLKVANTTNFVITADGTVPSGYPSGYSGVKPKNPNQGSATALGIRLPQYPMTCQIDKILTQVNGSSTRIESQSYGNQTATINWAQYAGLHNLLATPGIVTRSVATALDPDNCKPDICGAFLYTKSQVDTGSANAFIDAFRIKDSKPDSAKNVTEKLFLRTLQSLPDVLFLPGKTPDERLAILPPGMCLTLTITLISGSDRLETGIPVSVSDGATPSPTFTDSTAQLFFNAVNIRYQAIQLPNELVNQMFSTGVPGYAHPQEMAMNAVTPMFAAAPVAKYLYADIEIQSKAIDNNTTSFDFKWLTSPEQPMPDVMFVYIDNTNAWTTKGLATTNWDWSSWANGGDKVASWKLNTAQGGADRPDFMLWLPGNDYNPNDKTERSLALDAANQQLFTSLYYQQSQYSVFSQQQTSAVASWINKGYTFSTLPGQQVLKVYRDPTASIIPDLSSGPENSTLSFNIGFTEPVSGYTFYIVAFRRSVQVLNVSGRPAVDNESALTHTYDPLINASGIAQLPTDLSSYD